MIIFQWQKKAFHSLTPPENFTHNLGGGGGGLLEAMKGVEAMKCDKSQICFSKSLFSCLFGR